jgi:hypothetical protein
MLLLSLAIMLLHHYLLCPLSRISKSLLTVLACLICLSPSFVVSFVLPTTATTFHSFENNHQPLLALSSKTSRHSLRWMRFPLKRHPLPSRCFCFCLRSQNGDNDTATAASNDDDFHENDHDDHDDDDDLIRLHLDLSKLCQIIMTMEDTSSSGSTTCTGSSSSSSTMEPLLKAVRDELLRISWEDEITLAESSSSFTTVPDCVPENIREYRRFCSYFESDICHDGRFTVFGTTTTTTTIVSEAASKKTKTADESDNNKSFRSSGTASLHPDVLFALDDPLSYIRDVLSCPSDPQYPTSQETVVVLPGPNAPHQLLEGKRGETLSTTTTKSSPEMVEYYSKVLGGIGLAQLHCGSQIRHGDIVISDRSVVAELEGWLMEHGLLEHDSEIFGGAKSIVLDAADRDFLRLLCHYLSNKKRNKDHNDAPNMNDDPTKTFRANKKENDDDAFRDSRAQRSVLKLVDAAVNAVSKQHLESVDDNINTDDAPHLVLLAHSGSTIQVARAIEDWKLLRRSERIMSVEEMENLLRRALTVVTVGSVCRTFPDGPAYFHLSFTDDPLASTFGFRQQRQTQGDGGGKDAVHVRTYSPYLAPDGRYTIQAHNMGACGIQCLALLLRVNGTRSFRKLFELASTEICSDISTQLFAVASQTSEMHVPPNLEDELLPALIRATKGDQWLWDREKGHWGDDDDDDDDDSTILPNEEVAGAILEWQFGYDAYDDIVGACSESLQYDECQLLE